jgi:iron complex transport system ATP-binding protein
VSAALAFANVSASYGGRAALSDVTASLAPGTITGIVGPNGAGKTTLLRVGLGLVPCGGGEVRVRDRVLKDWSREALARTIAYLPQGGTAHWPLPARDLVMLGRLPHRGAFAIASAEDARIVDGALARADASAFATRRMDELSAGERARVLFARALATQAPILLADEPAAWLDPAHQLKLMALLRDEAARGTTIAVTLHDLSLAARHCDSILVLHEGRVAASGAPDLALSDEVLAGVFGIAAVRVTGPDSGQAALLPWRLTR